LWILPRRSVPPTADESLDRRHVFSGLRDIVDASHTRAALLTVLATSTLCEPLIIFCPVLVKDVLHGDANEFSLAIGAFGIGGLLGAIGLLGVDAQRDRRWLSSGFAASYGAITALAAINPWFWGLPILLVFGGRSMAVSNTSANALLQATVATPLRGRTISLFMLAMRSGISIGSLITGVSVHLL
jgi:predicted MFS family arabinose efflux permease